MQNVSFSKVIVIAFLCAYMAVLPACNKDSNPSTAGETAPELPSIETMQLDQQLLNFFTTSVTQTVLGKTNQTLPRQNWLTAVFVVSVFNVLVLAGLAIPVAATSAALSVEPTFESDGKWHWNYTYQGPLQTHDLELTGQVLPGKTVWEMYVTRQLPTELNHFLWYSGEAEISGENGFWVFYDDTKPNENAEVIGIDWTVNSETDREITFTDRNVDSPGLGNTLNYDLLTPNVTMTIVNATAGDSTEVSWNMDSGEGHIIAPDYNDGNKACWNSTQENIDCVN